MLIPQYRNKLWKQPQGVLCYDIIDLYQSAVSLTILLVL